MKRAGPAITSFTLTIALIAGFAFFTRPHVAQAASANALFSASTASPYPPVDIRSQVPIVGGGAILPQAVVCIDSSARAQFSGKLPVWHEPILIQSCGWRAGNIVSIFAQSPNGATTQAQVPASNGQFQYVFRNSRNDADGSYNFVISTEGAPAAYLFVPVSKTGALRLYREDDSAVLLGGFRANEPLRLFQYCDNGQNAGVMVRWQQYVAGPGGDLLVTLDPSVLNMPTRCFYAAVGAASGEITQLSSAPIFGQKIVQVPQPGPPLPVGPTAIPINPVLPPIAPLATAIPLHPAKAEIIAPLSGSVLHGIVDFYGTANIPGFGYYKFEFVDSRCANGVCFVSQFDKPVVNGRLMQWDTRTVPNGTWLMQMRVVDKQGRVFGTVPVIQIVISN